MLHARLHVGSRERCRSPSPARGSRFSGSRCDREPPGTHGGGGLSSAVPSEGTLVDVHLLRPGAASLGRRGVQAHPGGAGGGSLPYCSPPLRKGRFIWQRSACSHPTSRPRTWRTWSKRPRTGRSRRSKYCSRAAFGLGRAVGNDGHDPSHSSTCPGATSTQRPRGPPSRPEIPASPERYLVRVPISKKTHDKLRRAQALLSHSVPSGDVAQVLDRALDALISQLERRKAALVSRPRRAESRRRSSSERARFETPSQATPNRTEAPRPRHIPAHVRRAVWQRDLGQCTFVSPSDHRCTARRFLEYDHIEPVARGGRATVAGMRLRCRAHNQYEAERIFGAEFMTRKRNAARLDMDVTRSAERPGAAATRQTR